MNYGKAIEAVMNKLFASPADLKVRTNISLHRIDNIVTSHYSPTASEIKQICSALGVEPKLLGILAIEESDVPAERRHLYDALYAPLAHCALELLVP